MTMLMPKISGILLIVLGIPFGIGALDGVLPPTYFAAAGLLVIFFSPERINDERVQQLKMKAIYTAMSAGLGLTFLAYVLLTAVFRLGSPALLLRNGISAWDFMAGVMALSLLLFYFYRWQDARPDVESAETPAPTFEVDGRKFHRAPWSTTLRVLSLLATAVLLGAATGLARRSGVIGWLPAAGLVVLWLGSILFVIRGYAVDGHTLLVRRLGWLTRVPLTGLVSATVDPLVMRDSVRVWGNGGMFSFSGHFRSDRLGSFRAYVTHPAHTVVLRLRDRTVVISPAAPEAFIRELPAMS